MKEITIKDEYIKLQQAMKLAKLVGSGSEAKIYITEGLVLVNGEVCTERGRKLRNEDIFEFNGESVIVHGSISNQI